MSYYCCDGKRERKRHVLLVFRRAELLYDAENCSYVEGDLMEEGDGHPRHQVFDIGQEGNVDRVTRVLNLAHAECVEMLYPYTMTRIHHRMGKLDDILAEPDAYRIVLELPEDFSMTTVKLLKHLVHEYLVCRVVADWMSITKPDSRPNWEEKSLSLKARIQAALLSRTGKVRRKLKPF